MRKWRDKELSGGHTSSMGQIRLHPRCVRPTLLLLKHITSITKSKKKSNVETGKAFPTIASKIIASLVNNYQETAIVFSIKFKMFSYPYMQTPLLHGHTHRCVSLTHTHILSHKAQLPFTSSSFLDLCLGYIYPLLILTYANL